MKLFHKIASISLGLSLALGIGVVASRVGSDVKEARADEQLAYTFTAKYNGSNSDATSEVTNSASSMFSSSTSNISSTSRSKVYLGKSSVEALKFGSSSAKGTLTINLAVGGQVKATRVVFSIAAANDTSKQVVLSLNGATSGTGYNLITYGSTAGNFSNYEATWDGSTALTSIKVEAKNASSNRFYLKSITVYKNVTSNPSVSVSPTSLDLLTTNASGLTVTATPENIASPTYVWTIPNGSDYVELENTSSQTVTVKPIAAGNATVRVTCGGQTADCTVIVREPNAGEAASNPYTVAQARTKIDSGTDAEKTGVYTRGRVYQVDSYNSTYHSITYWISDDGTSTNPLEVYGGLGIDDDTNQFTSKDDIKVGDIVVVFGNLTKYGSTYEYSQNNRLISLVRRTLTSISMTGSLTKSSYYESESFDPTGLTFKAVFDDDSEETINSANIVWPSLTVGMTSIQGEYTIGTVTKKTPAITISVSTDTLASVVVSGSMSKKNYESTDGEWDRTGLIATAVYASGHEEVVTNDAVWTYDPAFAIGVTSVVATASYTDGVTKSGSSEAQTVSVVAAPNLHMTYADFAGGGYSVNDDGITVDGINFAVKDVQKQGTTAQMRASSGYIYNEDPLGQYITRVEIKVTNSDLYLRLGASTLSTSSGSQNVTIAHGDAVVVVPNANTYKYLRIDNNSTYSGIEYLKVWYAPFEPTVTLDETSFEFTQTASGEIEVNATATHFTNNALVSFSAVSSNQSVLADADINEDAGYFLIAKSDINPGTTTVTVTGTYLTEEATASFTITCNAASRNLLSISITTSSSDVEFEKGGKFSITGLVVTGTFDAAPLTADVTNGCVFKIGENTLTPGSSVLNTTGNFTIKVSHPDSEAGETLQYAITVVESSSLTLTPDLNGDSFAYGDTKYPSFSVNLNPGLTSNVALETYGLSRQNDNMQINPSKGTYLKNTIAIPGRIIRIEMDWTGNTPETNATPTIYFSDSYMDEKPIVGGTKATGGSSNSVSAIGNNSYFFVDGTTLGGWSQLTELRIVYIANDEGAARNFADNYLHMNDYDFGGVHGSTNGDGSCETYYGTAETAYRKLTGEQKLEFSKLSGAVARMTDWAAANGYTFDAGTGTFTLNSRVNVFGTNFGDNKNAVAIIAVISAISVIAIGAYFLLKKKHA